MFTHAVFTQQILHSKLPDPHYSKHSVLMAYVQREMQERERTREEERKKKGKGGRKKENGGN